MKLYDDLRQGYIPSHIKVLFIAESPPPQADVQSSRHFYRSEMTRKDDRLFVNTIKAIYPEAAKQTEAQLEPEKEQWLRRFQADGFYMIEALENSQVHEVTKQQRQERIRKSLPNLLTRVQKIAQKDTKIILIKSNVYEVATEPLRRAGYNVLNQELVDYPGRFNQADFRRKVAALLAV